jgi:Bacterial Ig-like domain (group 3)
VAPCTYSTTTEPTALEVGGTSVSTPAMAGVMALINQKAGASQGFPNAALYALAATQTYASCSTETVTTSSSCFFNDIDAGSASFAGTNEMACQPGSPNCTVAHSGDTVAVLSGYNSTTGFDLATGLGSLNVANVVNQLAGTPATGLVAPTVTVTPSSASSSVSQALMVTVAVSGSSGTPTGTVLLKGGGYIGTAQTLSSGGYSVTLPAFSLTSGPDVLVAAYSGDSNYQEGAGSATVTVSKVAPAGITVTPSSTSFAANAAVTVTGAVTAATGGPTPTGSVTLSAGTYTSAATALSSGNYSITIPASTFSAGAVTLTATYSGDNTYSSISNTAGVTVTAAVAGTYTLAPSPATSAIAPGATATATITATGSNNYTGNVTLTCTASTSNPANQSGDAPSCTIGIGNPIALTASTTSGTVTASVTTAAATSGALVRPALGRNNELTLAGLGGAALALLALLGIPKQRRAIRSMLGMLAVVLMLGGLAACGGGGGGSSSGGGGGSGGGGTSNPGTAAGMYTFTVSGTGSDTSKTAASTTFTVTVN